MDIVPDRGTAEFDCFQVDFKARRLLRVEEAGHPDLVLLGSRAFDILAFLVSRPGELVSKSDIIDAVWPDVVVEEANLTVQISALRRILDEGRQGPSCIQTVSRRGYRFLPEVRRDAADAGGRLSSVNDRPAVLVAPGPRYRWLGLVAAVLSVALVAIMVIGAVDRFRPHPPPRLSVAVLPFATDATKPDVLGLSDRLAESLATDLNQLWHLSLSPHQATSGYRDQSFDAKLVGHELGVRYLVEGSLRTNADKIVLHAALVSGETGAALWSDAITLPSVDMAATEDEAGTWLQDSIGIETTRLEAERGEREGSHDPLDLILQARALMLQPATRDRRRSARALLEQALKEDPTSYRAMASLAELLISNSTLLGEGVTERDIRKIEQLVMSAEAFAPTAELVLFVRAYLHRLEQHWPEARAGFEHLLAYYPHAHAASFMLGICRLNLGLANEAIPLFQKLVMPHASYGDDNPRYFRLGQAYLFTGRYEEAVPWFRKAIIADPERPPNVRHVSYAMAASALALAGRLDDARAELAKAEAIYPYFSASTFWDDRGTNDAAFAVQLDRVRQGLALAGLRLHIDEDVPGLSTPPDGLPVDTASLTPREVPGARLIRTVELGDLLEHQGAVVLDGETGRVSVPGAVSLPWISRSGTVSDDMQPELGRLLTELTGGDMAHPIVTLGISAYHWPGYNLARRAAALGYRNVFWYRGGRDAWMAAGRPMEPMRPDPLTAP